MRLLLEKTINYIERKYRPGNIIVVEAPTGYGKTVSAPLIHKVLYERGFSYNIIQVLPLRSIIEDFYLCKLVQSYGIRIESCRGGPPQELVKTLYGLGLSWSDIAYQMGEQLLRIKSLKNIVRKEPLYDAKYVVTTFDSFAYNFLRIPITEIFKARKHYAIPRLRLFTSTTIFDEAHILLKEGVDQATFTTILEFVIKYMVEAKTPLIIMSATLSSHMKNLFSKWSSNKIVFLRIGNENKENEKELIVRDKEYEEQVSNIKWFTKITGKDQISSIVSDNVQQGRRVLIVRYRVRDAIETYQALSNTLGQDNIVLIHGKLDHFDRSKALNNAHRASIVVATSIIEAGVDWSFETLITDHKDVLSIIQQAGRICRHFKDTCEAEIYLVESSDNKEFIGKIKEIANRYGIEWRLPYDRIVNGKKQVGISTLIEKCSYPVQYSRGDEEYWDLLRLTTPLFIPYGLINNILKKYHYSLVRTTLTQVVTEPKALEDLDNNIYDYVLTISFSELANKYRSQIDKLVSIGRKENELKIILCEDVGKNITLNKYIEFVSKTYSKAYEEGVMPVFTGFVLKEGAYKRGVGLVNW